MKVTLLSCTPDAINLLMFTKATRLNMTPGLLTDIREKKHEDKVAEIRAMARTIKSSWEFLDVVFLIEGLSRAAAQQVTRTRTASFAMQSQRVTDVREMPVIMPMGLDEFQARAWRSAEENAKHAYAKLIEDGVPKEDARGVLPMATACNLVAKYNLRNFTEMVKSRTSLRVQGEYALMVEMMRESVLDVWPWARPFFTTSNDAAIEILEEVVGRIGLTVGSGDGWDISKAIDLLRQE